MCFLKNQFSSVSVHQKTKNQRAAANKRKKKYFGCAIVEALVLLLHRGHDHHSIQQHSTKFTYEFLGPQWERRRQRNICWLEKKMQVPAMNEYKQRGYGMEYGVGAGSRRPKLNHFWGST